MGIGKYVDFLINFISGSSEVTFVREYPLHVELMVEIFNCRLNSSKQKFFS